MVVVTRAASAGPSTAVTRHREQVRGANEGKAAYKVVVEETLRPRRKLITSNYPQKEPPRGYTFVPAGDPQLTAQCKEFARQDGARVYVVSTTKHQDTQLSMEVHRIGYHFPSSIVDRAYIAIGAPVNARKRLSRVQKTGPTEKARKQDRRKGMSRIDKKALKNLQQKEVNQEARQAILDLFPAIPVEDLDVIIDRAFDLGSKKVGAQVDDLSLPRRVQLAVVAHIRHVYTDYDNVLKQVPWMQARSMVEQACLEKLAQWRGAEEEDPDAMEEILQEVIVIPDDDDDDYKDETRTSTAMEDTPPRDWGPGRRPPGLNESATHGYDVESARAGTTEENGAQHLGHGQYLLRREGPSWTERAGIHRDEVWRQAQTRVHHQPPVYQEAVSTNTAMSQRRLPEVANSVPQLYPGSPRRQHEPNILSFRDVGARSDPESNVSSRPSGISTHIPSDILPSVEPMTPRSARRMEYLRSPREPEVIYVEYPELDRERKIARPVNYEPKPESSIKIDRREYRPVRERAPVVVDLQGYYPSTRPAPQPQREMEVIPITENEWKASTSGFREGGHIRHSHQPQYEIQSLRPSRPSGDFRGISTGRNEIYQSEVIPVNPPRRELERSMNRPPPNTPRRVEPGSSFESPNLVRIDPYHRPAHSAFHRDAPVSYVHPEAAQREYIYNETPRVYLPPDRRYEKR